MEIPIGGVEVAVTHRVQRRIKHRHQMERSRNPKVDGPGVIGLNLSGGKDVAIECRLITYRRVEWVAADFAVSNGRVVKHHVAAVQLTTIRKVRGILQRGQATHSAKIVQVSQPAFGGNGRYIRSGGGFQVGRRLGCWGIGKHLLRNR